MSTSELFQAMHALALRYGVDKCEKVLKEVKFAVSQEQVKVNEKIGEAPTMLYPQDENFLEDTEASQLMRWCLSGTFPEKFSIVINGGGDGDDDFWTRVPDPRWWRELQKYSGLIAPLQHVGPTAGFQRVQSRLHTLYLNSVQADDFKRIFEDKGCIALFEEVVIVGEIHCVKNVTAKLVVNEGLISSMNDHRFDPFDPDKRVPFTNMFEVNCLKSLEVNWLRSVQARETEEFLSRDFAESLALSLNRHVQTFAEGSMLRHLDLENALLNLDPRRDADVFQDLLNAIGFLPNLQCFGIREPRDSHLLQILVETIGSWKIRQFKLWYVPGQDRLDLQPLFDVISTMKHIRFFSICFDELECLDDEYRTSQLHRTPQLFDLALSTTSCLLGIELEMGMLLVRKLSRLVPEDYDRAVAAQRHLRRFCMLSTDLTGDNLWDQVDDGDTFDFVRWMFTVVSKHLPYLYDVGITKEAWKYVEEIIRKDPEADSDLLHIWKNVWVQMELNRVGMTLLQSEVLPTVPGGLWSTVLHHALQCEKNPAQLPWTGIYTMVRALIAGGHTGWSESKQDSTREDSPPTKRPRQ